MKINQLKCVCFGLFLAASFAWGQTPVIDEEAEFLMHGIHLGYSMAIDNGIMVVGAPYASHNGVNAGAAYLYDATTGALLSELIPNDIDDSDEFGYSVAIDNGLVAVSSIRDNSGIDSGSVYLFSASTGVQIGKLVADDEDKADLFGSSIAINNGLIAIGAMGKLHVGAVYVFNAISHQQIRKILPDNTVGVSSFGGSVDMENGFIAVGAALSDNGGAAYLFDLATGNQLHQLVPTNQDEFEFYGSSVAIENQTIAIGSPRREGVGPGGAVYLFNGISGLQFRKLVPDQIESVVSFGYSIDIQNGIVLVGDILDISLSNPVGACYLFDSLTGNQLSKFHANDAAGYALFGISVAFDGDTICVGASRNDVFGNHNGSVYIFDAATLTQTHKLFPFARRTQFDLFGSSIAIGDSGSLVAIGMSKNDDVDTNAGKAYTFDIARHTHRVYFQPDPGSTDALFGDKIDFKSTTVAVGASGDSDNGASAGAVYTFNATTGNKLAKITPNDPAPGDFFGGAVALNRNGGTLAVGAALDDDNGTNSGSVYLFFSFTGLQLLKITPADGQPDDRFGEAIAMDQNILVVGAPRDNDNGPFSGSVYLYDSTTGNQLFKLLADDGEELDSFGRAVAIHDGLVVVGAVNNTDGGVRSGAVYLFDASNGNQLAKFVPSDGIDGGEFGKSVSIDRGLIAVGAWIDDASGSASGSAYLFGANTQNELYKLVPSNGSADARFGNAISVRNGVVVVGASLNDRFGQNSGAAYLFDAPDDICPADFTGDYVMNFFDVSAFLSAFSNQDPSADITNDGVFNFFDVSAFLQAFTADCP